MQKSIKNKTETALGATTYTNCARKHMLKIRKVKQ